MKLVDVDNQLAVKITEAQGKLIRKEIDTGRHADEFGDVIVWDEIIEVHGDLCVDEDLFQQIRDLLDTLHGGDHDA